MEDRRTTTATAAGTPAVPTQRPAQRPAPRPARRPDHGSPDRRCVADVVRTAAQARAICATG